MSSRGGVLAAVVLGATISSAAIADEIKVVASFKPIHSLVAGVMAGVGEPTLLIKGAASPHDYALRSSDAAALEQADLVFWIGANFETFLVSPLGALSSDGRSVALGRIDGLTLLPVREGGLWEPRDSQGSAAGEQTVDGHVWLDPRNAEVMVAAIAKALGERDPVHITIYESNAGILEAKLDRLDSQLETQLVSVKGVPFIVFHDAFQYFETRFGLNGVGSITLDPEQQPGARRLQQIRERMATKGVTCVFREPNFEPAVLDTVIEGTDARTGTLDPEGAALTEGPELYFELMRGNADALKSCLAAGG